MNSVLPRLAAGCVATILLPAALLLTGCGGKDVAPAHAAPGHAAADRAADGAPADAGFARRLLVHHRQGIELATLAADRAADPRVRELARTLAADQRARVGVLTGRLRGWNDHGTERPEADDELPGLMASDDVRALRDARGADFDWTFLSMMIEHQMGAVAMARQYRPESRDTQVRALADQITGTSDSRLTAMRELLGAS